jgi:hypothetical protein
MGAGYGRRVAAMVVTGQISVMRVTSGVLGTCVLALGTCLGCSEPSNAQLGVPPPSAEAAPWVACYTCQSSLTGIPTPGGSSAASFTNGLRVTASGNTLTAQVAELMGDSGTYACWMKADVTGPGQSTLETQAVPWVCPVEAPDLIRVQYMDGTFSLDAGTLVANLSVVFALPGTAADGGPVVTGAGRQVSTCKAFDADAAVACPWD